MTGSAHPAGQEQAPSLTDVPLPTFDRPPVSEVVLAVAFESVPGFDLAQIGALWHTRFRSEFPKSQQQAPFDPPVERFPTPAGPPPLAFHLASPTPRVWLLDEHETQLIQLQPDWFARNWRKLSDTDEYPRFSTLRGSFSMSIHALAEHLHSLAPGSFRPTQCEVTYVNTIRAGRLWREHPEIANVLTTVRPPVGGVLRDLEETRFASSYGIRTNGEQVGRLHVVAQPGWDMVTRDPVIMMNLTARGRPIGDGIIGVMSFLDLGHQWIVRGFAELTTAEAHQEWGRSA